MNRRFIPLLLLLLCGFVGCNAATDSFADETNFYVGGNIGQSRVKLDEAVSDLNSALAARGFFVLSNTKNDTDTAYRIFGGYKFNNYFALEAGYVDFGKFSLSAVTGPGTVRSELKASGWTLDALGMLPVGNNFSVLGRLGAIRSEVKESLSASGGITFASGANLNPTATKTSYDFGLGLQYDFNKTVGIKGGMAALQEPWGQRYDWRRGRRSLVHRRGF